MLHNLKDEKEEKNSSLAADALSIANAKMSKGRKNMSNFLYFFLATLKE